MPVRYEPISRAEWRADLEALAALPNSVVNADMAKHISTLGHALSLRKGQNAPDLLAVERLIDRPPVSLQQFIRGHAAHFKSGSADPHASGVVAPRKSP